MLDQAARSTAQKRPVKAATRICAANGSVLRERNTEAAQSQNQISCVRAAEEFDLAKRVARCAQFVVLVDHLAHKRKLIGLAMRFQPFASALDRGFEVVERAVAPDTEIVKYASDDELRAITRNCTVAAASGVKFVSDQ